MGVYFKLKLAISCVAVVLCCFQVGKLTVEFLKMRVLTKIDIVVPETVKIPGLTICAPYQVFLNHQRLKTHFPDFAEHLKNVHRVHPANFTAFIKLELEEKDLNVLIDFIENITVQQLMNVSFRSKEVFPIVFVRSPNGSMSYEPTDLCRQVRYIKDGRTCYTTACGEDEIPSKVLASSGQGRLVGIGISKIQNRTSNVEVFMHSPNRKIRDWRTLATLFSLDNKRIRVVAFSRTASKLLQYPYETNCKDYNEEGYESRYHKIEVCENRATRKRLGFVLPENTRYSNNNNLVGRDDIDEKHRGAAEEIRQICESESPLPDCEEEFYLPHVESKVRLDTNQTDSSLIIISTNLAPEIIKTSEPKTNFIEFITLACSTLAFWFGFSVAVSSIQILTMIKNKKAIKNVKRRMSRIPDIPKGHFGRSV